jgi:Mg/Co/Ni transporter MgtE
VNLFYVWLSEKNAINYCDAINGLKLEGESWVSAKIIPENVHYSLNYFSLSNFDTLILGLDDRAVQRVLREIDSQELVKALKGGKEPVKEKVFSNMSERAAKMLKDDMECRMWSASITDVRESQEKIIAIIRHLEEVGDIIIPSSKGATIA